MQKILIDIDPKSSFLDSREIQAAVTHELGHALFSQKPISSINERFADPTTSSEFQEACGAVRKIAANEFSSESAYLTGILNKYKSRDPRYGPAVDKIMEVIQSNSLDEALPQSENATLDAKAPNCQFSTFEELRNDIATSLGITSSQGVDQEAARTTFDELQFHFTNWTTNHTIYRAFTDSAYLGLDQSGNRIGEAGHPHESLDEAAASMLMITALYPEEFGRTLTQLASNQRKTVFKLYELVVNQFEDISPELRLYLNPKLAQVRQIIDMG